MPAVEQGRQETALDREVLFQPFHAHQFIRGLEFCFFRLRHRDAPAPVSRRVSDKASKQHGGRRPPRGRGVLSGGKNALPAGNEGWKGRQRVRAKGGGGASPPVTA